MAPLKLTPEEIAIITMVRKNSYQEINVQVQDSIIIFVNQILKFKRKKGGGLVFGNKPVINLKPPLKLSNDELIIIKKLRDKPFQQIVISIKNGVVDAINQTVKFRRNGGNCTN